MFSISCVSKDVLVTETYTETEQKQEPYTASEQYEIKTPHSTPLYKIEYIYQVFATFFLFNKDGGTIRWSQFTPFNKFPAVNTLNLELKGQNHRISIVAPNRCGKANLFACLYKGRSQQSAWSGFRPADIEFIQPYILESSRWRTYHIDEIKSLVLAGYGDVTTTKRCVDNLGESSNSTDFPLDELFQNEQWALIEFGYVGYLDQFAFRRYSDICFHNVSLDYVWDDIKTESRQVTKYRTVPVEVQRQRTVTKTLQVPFWEAIFSK
jgi:hypothetical protein